MRQQCGQPDLAGVLVDGRGLDGRDLVLAEALADNIKAARQRGIAEGPVALAGNGERMVAIRDFSGLVSSPWALASAAAMAPMVSLERCIGGLHVHEVEADRARFGAFGAQAVSGRLLGVLRHQLLQIGLGALML